MRAWWIGYNNINNCNNNYNNIDNNNNKNDDEMKRAVIELLAMNEVPLNIDA